jgi:hypothetical protein
MLMCLTLLAGAAEPAFACKRHRRSNAYASRHHSPRYTQTAYRNSNAYPRRAYYGYNRDRRSFWQKHRDKLTLAMGTGAGAAIGGLSGGKKGAAIGALLGAGGSALYTYKLRNRNRNRRY